MELIPFIDKEFAEHEAVLRETRKTITKPFVKLCEISERAIKAGGKILFFGNGGSAADAQHLAAELIVRYKVDRAPLPAIALTTDTSSLTAGANDFGYDKIFDLQMRALGRKGDVAVGISTSGNSPNVLRALETAVKIGVTPAAFSGCEGGKLGKIADPLLIVPSNVTARIQEMHIVLGHMFCDVLETRCGK